MILLHNISPVKLTFFSSFLFAYSTVAPACVAVGFLVSITGRFRWALWLGWALTILGKGVLVFLDVDTPTVSWIFITLVSGGKGVPPP